MKKILASALAIFTVLAVDSCAKVEKQISVVVREQGSGTREAFDRVVTDGTHFLEERGADGKKQYHTVKTAIQQTKTGTVLSTVASDRNAIGYISLDSVSDRVRMIAVNGVEASEETVLSGDYKIQRPFVVMTRKGKPLTDLTADFMSYLKSEAAEAHSKAAGCIFITDPERRANAGEEAIEVSSFVKQSALPAGRKILLRGSTSMEKFAVSAAKGYAELYGAEPEEIFDIQLEGSSVGRKAVEEDSVGNVIGLSSAAVKQEDIHSFYVCLDAIVVIVHRENTSVTDLTLAQLYDIFSGRIIKFSEIK